MGDVIRLLRVFICYSPARLVYWSKRILSLALVWYLAVSWLITVFCLSLCFLDAIFPPHELAFSIVRPSLERLELSMAEFAISEPEIPELIEQPRIYLEALNGTAQTPLDE